MPVQILEPMPYDFGFEVRDLEGNEQYRNEQSDGNRVTGSYGYFGPDGIYRYADLEDHPLKPLSSRLGSLVQIAHCRTVTLSLPPALARFLKQLRSLINRLRFARRHVSYIADELGFRAKIHTSEPGVAAQNPANVKIITEPLLPQPAPVPGGRILRPIEQPGIFDPR